MVKVAEPGPEPAVKLTVPSSVLPSKNATEPDRLPAVAEETAAVSTTGCCGATFGAEVISIVVVAAFCAVPPLPINCTVFEVDEL